MATERLLRGHQKLTAERQMASLLLDGRGQEVKRGNAAVVGTDDVDKPTAEAVTSSWFTKPDLANSR